MFIPSILKVSRLMKSGQRAQESKILSLSFISFLKLLWNCIILNMLNDCMQMMKNISAIKQLWEYFTMWLQFPKLLQPEFMRTLKKKKAIGLKKNRVSESIELVYIISWGPLTHPCERGKDPYPLQSTIGKLRPGEVWWITPRLSGANSQFSGGKAIPHTY